MIKGKINGLLNIGHWPTCILRGQFLCHTDPLYPKYNISPSNSLQDMEQNYWTVKYRSLAYIYLMMSIFVSHRSNIPTMMFIHQIFLKILSKITRSWNIGHVDLYLFWGQSLCHTVTLSKNMTLIHQIVFDIRQNQWTIKYVTVTYIYFEVILTHNPKGWCSYIK